MGHPTGTQDPRRFRMQHLPRLLFPIVGVFVALAAISIVYFSYDLVKDRMSPCEGIFRQTALNLSTHIKFLKADGELHIGKEAVSELDERAQMVALDLKTCCTVLDAGRIDPEQFLKCKANARTYDAKLQNIAALVGAVPAVASQGAPSAVPSSQSSTTPPATSAPDAIAGGVEAARAASRAFNEQVVQVSKEQALRTLQTTPPNHAEISAQEREPNDDALNSNIIELDNWITASIGSSKDGDISHSRRQKPIVIGFASKCKIGPQPLSLGLSCSIRRNRASARSITRRLVPTSSTRSSHLLRPPILSGSATTTDKASAYISCVSSPRNPTTPMSRTMTF